MEARFSAPVQTCPGAHPASCTIGIGSFPGVKSGRSVTLTLHPLPVPWSRKSTAYTSTPPMGCTACTEHQCLYSGALYLYLYLYSSYGPYGLNRASLPAQERTLPLILCLKKKNLTIKSMFFFHFSVQKYVYINGQLIALFIIFF